MGAPNSQSSWPVKPRTPSSNPNRNEVTHLLHRWQDGDEDALEVLTPVVYGELHRLAHRHMRGERPDHLLQTTALVHEAFLRLVGVDGPWQGRRQFYAVAAGIMRRVLVDHARRRDSAKRGAGAVQVTLSEDLLSHQPELGVLALDEALTRLGERDPRKVRVIELRCFAGMTIEETAEILEVSHTTIEKDLKLARVWLTRELQGTKDTSP
jgi:RNA polymerase sigma-70 factor, ECF subfamily